MLHYTLSQAAMCRLCTRRGHARQGHPAHYAGQAWASKAGSARPEGAART